MSLAIDSLRTAILTLDLQPAIFSLGEVPFTVLESAVAAVGWARSQGIKVIHIATGFEDGYPELPTETEWKPFRMWPSIQANKLLLKSDNSTHVFRDIYNEDDTVIWKSRASAFVRASDDLDKLLRSQGIDCIIMFGVATSGALLSTVRSGWDLDWKMLVMQDGCWDRDQEVHECLITKVIAERSKVVTLKELLRS